MLFQGILLVSMTTFDLHSQACSLLCFSSSIFFSRFLGCITNYAKDEGVPALYWLCAESPITLVSICLPATLSLGRHLMNSYFIPLSSRVISLVSSKKGSTGSLGEGRSNHRGPGGSRFDAFRRLKEVRGWNSFAYAEGVSIRSEIPLVPATLHGQEYEAEIHSDGSSHNKDSTQLGGAIHAGKSFDVSHHDKGA